MAFATSIMRLSSMELVKAPQTKKQQIVNERHFNNIVRLHAMQLDNNLIRWPMRRPSGEAFSGVHRAGPTLKKEQQYCSCR